MNQPPKLFSQPKNFAGLPASAANFEFSRVAILSAPYDSTTEWHGGSRKGPRSIIDASYYLEWYDIELQKEIFNIGIHTLDELEPVLSSPEAMIKRVYEASHYLLSNSKFVVTLGGEHSISLGSIRAHIDKYDNCCVLQLDAHCDLRDQYLGTKYGHACVMRRVSDLCPITQVGIRAMSAEEKDYITSRNMQPFFYGEPGCAWPIDKIIEQLTENVYITIDLDVFDPSIMSAVGTPEPGGISWHQALSLLDSVSKKRRIVGFDVVELSPDQGTPSCSFLAAKLTYKLIGYSFRNH